MAASGTPKAQLLYWEFCYLFCGNKLLAAKFKLIFLDGYTYRKATGEIPEVGENYSIVSRSNKHKLLLSYQAHTHQKFAFG